MADGIISKIQLPDNTIYDVVDNTSGYMTGMTILSYGSSTWQNFIDAYSSNKVVYCRASSNANPATGSQTRLAFMAYVNNATTPTEVEFQYYRSVSSHTASQQGDQIYVYKLDKTAGWSVIVREASVKVVAGTGLGGTYSNGTMTLTGPTKVSDLTNDSGFIITETDPTVPSWAKESTKPSYNFSEIGNTPTTLSGYGITNAYTKTEVDNLLLALPEPMVFKGSLGTGGTITVLPAAAATNEGFVYKVITDGTYASQAAKVGDTFVSDGSSWVLIPSGDEPSGTVTSVGLSNATNGGLTISGSPITSSGSITVGHTNVLTSAQSTSAVYPITIDKNGHIASYGSAVTIPTTSGKTATLTTTWTSNQQTVTVSGVTSSNYVVVSPAPASYDDYCEAGIYCSAQGTNSLTFKCDTAPTSSLTVNVMIVG